MPGACWGCPINESPSCSRQPQGKASAPMGVAFALLAPADPRAIAAIDHAGTRLDDLHSVVLHVVIRLKIRANLDAPGRVDLKNRTEKRRNRHVWMNCRVIRDREAPGSNPGPPDHARRQAGSDLVH